MNRAFHVLKTPAYRFDLYGRYQILWTDIAHFQYRPANKIIFAKFEVRSSLRSDAIVITTDRQTLLKCLKMVVLLRVGIQA